MSLAEASEQRRVWVYYSLMSGAVSRVMYREPRPAERPDPSDGTGMMETTLSMQACAQVHQLVVHGGRVVVRGSLTRRR